MYKTTLTSPYLVNIPPSASCSGGHPATTSPATPCRGGTAAPRGGTGEGRGQGQYETFVESAQKWECLYMRELLDDTFIGGTSVGSVCWRGENVGNV